MVRHKKHAPRSKSRQKYRKGPRKRGKPSVNVMLRKFDVGDIVHVCVNPSVHKALPYRRFIGKTGTVTSKRGECYFVQIRDCRSRKKIIIHPAHLKLQQKAVKKATKVTTKKTVKKALIKTKQ